MAIYTLGGRALESRRRGEVGQSYPLPDGAEVVVDGEKLSRHVLRTPD